MRHFLTSISLICFALSLFVFTSCAEISIEEGLPSQEEGVNDIDKENTGEDGKDEVKEEDTTESSGPKDDDQVLIEQDQGQLNDVMFYNDKVNFAFIYPQSNLTLSSYPEWSGDYGDLSLNISIFSIDDLNDSLKENAIAEMEALEEGRFGPEDDFLYTPSKDVVKIGDKYVKQYLILSRYDECDVTFQWNAHFYNGGNIVQLNLSADKDKIISQQKEYFITDNSSCPGQLSWDNKRQAEFYDKLITGQLTGVVSEWYETIESIMYLLQINDFKGASAGYSRLLDERFYEENLDEKYVIDVSFPQFQSATTGGLDETLNKFIHEDIVEKSIEDFKEEISSYDDEEFIFNYYLGIDYSVLNYDDKMICLRMDTYPYLGGAHGMLYFDTINFSLKDMEMIGLEDLFVPGYEYREKISEYCRQDLVSQMDDMGFDPDIEWIEDGTDPSYSDTLTNYLITPGGLIIKFPAYQVAPYAAGDFTVNIPYEIFGDNLNPDSIVNNYAQ